LLIHAYVVQNWLRIPIFTSFEHVAAGLGLDNLTQILMQTLMHEGCPMKNLISKWLMNFGADGIFVFQGTRSSVIIQIVNGWAPHFMGVHCMVHRTTLWFKFCHICKWWKKLKVCFKPCIIIFPKALKGIWNLWNWHSLWKQKGPRFWNLCWISMLFPTQCVMA
jgi:hypothetical protein